MVTAVDKRLTFCFESAVVTVPMFNNARKEYRGAHIIDGDEKKPRSL